jgi:hypothetical protein
MSPGVMAVSAATSLHENLRTLDRVLSYIRRRGTSLTGTQDASEFLHTFEARRG